MRVFLSYAHNDRWIVRTIATQLKQRGAEVLLDHSLQAGDELNDEIRRLIELSDLVFVLLTPGSISSSWVKSEFRYAQSLCKRICAFCLYVDARQFFPADCELVAPDINEIEPMFLDKLEQLSASRKSSAPQPGSEPLAKGDCVRIRKPSGNRTLRMPPLKRAIEMDHYAEREATVTEYLPNMHAARLSIGEVSWVWACEWLERIV